MKIVEYLDHPIQYQALNKRLYQGITPHWFNQIKQRRLSIRLSETTGVSNERMERRFYEYPDQDYLDSLSNDQRRSLRITEVSRKASGDWKFVLSTGDHS